MPKYICDVAKYYPSFYVEAETDDDAWNKAVDTIWNDSDAEVEINVEVCDDSQGTE